MYNNRPTGIFGGTFDPIHRAHLKLAKYAYKELSLEQVIFIPAYIPPHKTGKVITAESHRLNMTRLAVESCGFPASVSDIEITMGGSSYTARTLTVLKEKYSDLVFILGADSYLSLGTWYHPKIIFEKAEIACAVRNGISKQTIMAKSEEYKRLYNGVTHILDMPDTNISSTDIRLNNLEDICNSVPSKVFEYIKGNGLYGN